MSEAIDELQPRPEPGDLESTINSVDEAREVLFAAMSNYVQRPRAKQQAAIVDCANDLTESFRVSMELVHRDSLTDNQEKAQIAARMLEEDSRKRVSHLKQLLPQSSLTRKQVEWTKLRDEILGSMEVDDDDIFDYSDDEFPDFIEMVQESNQSQDIAEFMKSCDKTWRGRANNIGTVALRHGIDISKTAAGTAIGVGIAYYISRH